MGEKECAELLVRCLSLRVDDARPASLARLSAADWDGMIRLSLGHGAAPLLYQRLATHHLGASVPASIMQTLRQTYLENAARNVQGFHELSRVLRTLQNDRIPVIVLKGAHLAEVVYGNIALRPMADIDLMVKWADAHRTENALLRLGYAPRASSPKRPLEEAEWYQEKFEHLHYVRKRGLGIEVHWRIEPVSSPVQMRTEGLWERAQPARIANVDALVLSPEDLVLHLCLHASYHHKFQMGLRPLCDLAQTVRRYQDELDWRTLHDTANDQGIGKYVHCTLLLVKTMLGSGIPSDVLVRLEPKGFDARVLGVIQDYILFLPTPSLDVPTALQRALRRGGFRGRMAALLRGVFPTLEHLQGMYGLPPGSKKAYFYYPVRLFDLVRRRGKVVLQLVFGTKRGKLSLNRERSMAAIEKALEPPQP